MPDIWTLSYNGGEPAILKDFGICADFTITHSNRQKATATFRTNEGFDAADAPQFAFMGKGAIYRNGALFFQGYFDDPIQELEGNRQYIHYRLHDAWWLFERHSFKQWRNQFGGWINGDPNQGPILTPVVAPEVYLGETVNEVWQTNGMQVVEIINWVNECHNPTKRGATTGRDNAQDVVQAGSIDPQVIIPVNRNNQLFCSEAIINVLRLTPDTVVFVDSTTPTPTLHVKRLSKWTYPSFNSTTGVYSGTPAFIDYTNLPEVSINITTEQEKNIHLQKKLSRQLPGVIIYYKSMANQDGVISQSIVLDKYPPAVTDFTPEVSSHFVELAGASLFHVQANVKTADLSAYNTAAWWIAHDKSLQDPLIDPASITVVGSPSIVDDSTPPVAINLTTYPRQLLSPLPNWTGCVSTHGTVVATVSFNRYTDGAHHVLETKKTSHVIRHSIRLTNAATQLYTAISSYSAGEAAPAGLAEQVYRSVNAVMHEGQITLTNAQARADVYMGCRLALVGPNSTFDNLMVQSISVQPPRGRMTVNYGPSAPADVSGLIELARSCRTRTLYNMPSGRASGGTSGGDTIDAGADSTSENTAHGVGGCSLDTASAPA